VAQSLTLIQSIIVIADYKKSYDIIGDRKMDKIINKNKSTYSYNCELNSIIHSICTPMLDHMGLKRICAGKFILNEDKNCNKIQIIDSNLNSLKYLLFDAELSGTSFNAAVRDTNEDDIGFFIWPENTLDPILSIFRDKFTLKSGLSIYKKTNTFIEACCFSTDREGVFSTISSKDLYFLLEWVKHYHSKLSLLPFTGQCIMELSTPIKTTHIDAPNSLKKFKEALESTNSYTSDSNSFLSCRQYQCLYLLAHGKGIKEIAKVLGVSPSTVAAHLEIVKEKCQKRYKSEIIEFFHKNFSHSNRVF
jgi:hypothetical protein